MGSSGGHRIAGVPGRLRHRKAPLCPLALRRHILMSITAPGVASHAQTACLKVV